MCFWFMISIHLADLHNNNWTLNAARRKYEWKATTTAKNASIQTAPNLILGSFWKLSECRLLIFHSFLCSFNGQQTSKMIISILSIKYAQRERYRERGMMERRWKEEEEEEKSAQSTKCAHLEQWSVRMTVCYCCRQWYLTMFLQFQWLSAVPSKICFCLDVYIYICWKWQHDSKSNPKGSQRFAITEKRKWERSNRHNQQQSNNWKEGKYEKCDKTSEN